MPFQRAFEDKAHKGSIVCSAEFREHREIAVTGREARQGVDLDEIEKTVCRQPEIDPSEIAAAEDIVYFPRGAKDVVCGFVVKRGRALISDVALVIFFDAVAVNAVFAVRLDVFDLHRRIDNRLAAVADDADGELPPVDIFLDQQILPIQADQPCGLFAKLGGRFGDRQLGDALA
jgi:hypothetical protein